MKGGQRAVNSSRVGFCMYKIDYLCSMRSVHQLDKAFGPGGSFAGIILVIIGFILVPFYWTASILILLGAFTGFSGSGCEVDTDRRRVRPCYLIFGLFKSGTWIETDRFHGIRVVLTKSSYRTFSLSNRAMYTTHEDYSVVLEAGTPQSRVEVMKSSTREEALSKAEELAKQLGMNVLDPRS